MRRRALQGSGTIAAALIAVCVTFAPTEPARAGKSAVNPVTTFIESVTVGAGKEHRLLVIHPVERATDIAPDPKKPGLVDAGAQTSERIGVVQVRTGRKAAVRFENVGEEQAFIVPGTIVRTKVGDFTVPSLEHAAPLGRVEVAVTPVSLKEPEIASPGEPQLLSMVLPPTLRYHTRPGVKHRESNEFLRTWMRPVLLETDRKSVADLTGAATIKKRVADYRKRLAKLGGNAEGAEQVGYVALVDGMFVAFEVFSRKEHFEAAWPRILEGLAVEASLDEVRQGLVEEDIPDTGDPDRYLRAVRERILQLYPERPTERATAAGAGRHVQVVGRNGDLARTVVIGGEVRYLLSLTDPKRRKPETAREDLDAGLLNRKSRLTGEQDRVKKRRGGAGGNGGSGSGLGGDE